MRTQQVAPEGMNDRPKREPWDWRNHAAFWIILITVTVLAISLLVQGEP